jgi:GT2 family glycosyltransferase
VTRHTAQPSAPRTRVVVVNFNGGELTLQCLERVLRTDWPRDQLEVVIVDNASTDGLVARARAELPEVRVIESPTNLGFAGGCNLALRDLTGIDYVALLNNDVMVDGQWLSPLVRVLESDPSLGAACPKILFAASFLDVGLESPTHRLGGGDRRAVGVRVSGVRVAGRDVTRDAQFWQGFWGPEHGGASEAAYQWSQGTAVVRVPVADEFPAECELRLAADHPTRVVLSSGDMQRAYDVRSTPSWYAAPLDGVPFDVVNNVGSELTADGYGVDRGYQQRDTGQYEREEDVFAWCGGAVLLRSTYLAEVGLLDERLFLYYEDLELSWRGREHGWRYRYVPDSVVRHLHSASSIEGSATFAYYNERNRLLTLARHAAPRDLARQLIRYLLITGSYTRRDIVSPILRGAPARLTNPARRLRALAGFAAAAPTMLRRSSMRRPSISGRQHHPL